MQHVTYSELVDHFGDRVAHELLKVVEQHTPDESNVTLLDRNARLAKAFHRMNRQFLAIQKL